jgi:hypothetical protein
MKGWRAFVFLVATLDGQVCIIGANPQMGCPRTTHNAPGSHLRMFISLLLYVIKVTHRM